MSSIWNKDGPALHRQGQITYQKHEINMKKELTHERMFFIIK